MKTITITIKENQKQYPIFIGENILEKLNLVIDLKKYSKTIIITDRNIAKHWLKTTENQVQIPHTSIIINPGEKEKNIETVKYIWSKMIDAKLDRKSLVINLGGGVIGDIGGFAASTYMRGIDFVQIPTSITASVDAMVGGKVGINFGAMKNYIGSFQQPAAVIIDVQTIKTLPQREYLEGFAEIIKHGLIADKNYFDFVTSKKPQDFTISELIEIITGSNKIKANIVQKDEKEENLRKILNFGHTIGHAIESLSLETNFPLMHGEAVHIGMMVETKISELSGLLSKQEAKIIYQKLSQTGLPVTIKNIKTEDILEKIKSDKKNQGNQINWTLLKGIGKSVYDQKVKEKIVEQTFHMAKIKVYPLQKPIDVAIEIPGSLSYTVRALNIAAMVKGSVKIINPVKSDDSYAMVNILKTLGITIEEGENFFIVHGDISNIKDREYILDVNISGRTARSVLALLTIVPGVKILTCQEGFKKRPIKDLVDGLKQLGAKIEYLEKEGFLPVKIYSGTLHSQTIRINGNMSSQYISAIMMIAPLVGEVTIEVIGKQASKPFIDVTIDIMKEFGVEVINDNYKQYTIKKDRQYKNIHTYTVEADAIAAGYFFGIAALTKSRIKVLHISPKSKQGDIQFADILKKMGCIVEKNIDDQWISVQGRNILTGIEINMNSIPDSVPTLAVTSLFAKGKTKITGLAHLKIKESNRIESPKEELKKMGIRAYSSENSLEIIGGYPQTTEINTHGDHRIAMAFAMAGTKLADGIIINNPQVVNKSFPGFWEKLHEIGIKTEYL